MPQTVLTPKTDPPRHETARRSSRAAASTTTTKSAAPVRGATLKVVPRTAAGKAANAKATAAAANVARANAKKAAEAALAEARTPAPRWKKPSKEEAYVRYAPLVKYVVDRIASNVPKYVERDDLLNAAALGLFDALEKYDAAKGTKFETYAVWRIRGAVLDELRSMDWASRSVRRKARQLDSVCRELDQKLGRQATEQEIAAEMEVTTNQFGRILDEVRGVVLLSLNQPASENEETGAGGLAELIEDSRAVNALDKIEKDEMKDVLLDVFNQLTEPEKLVLALYYYEEMTLKEIGETLDISESRASQIHTKAIGRVRRRLGRTMQGAA